MGGTDIRLDRNCSNWSGRTNPVPPGSRSGPRRPALHQRRGGAGRQRRQVSRRRAV